MDSYDFASKHLYRQRRETIIDRFTVGNAHMRKVAYLDTGEALDTIAYLRRGYQPQNLWAVNNSPAQVAQLTKTLKTNSLPLINTIGLDFEDALDRRIPEVDIIDFDGMSCLNSNLTEMLQRIVAKRPRAVYGITLLAGRELDVFNRLVKSDENTSRTSFNTVVNPNHERRLQTLLAYIRSQETCIHHIHEIAWDVYMSTSRQPMLWSVFKSTECCEVTGKYIVATLGKNNIIPAPTCCILSGGKNIKRKYKQDVRVFDILLKRINLEISLSSIAVDYRQEKEDKVIKTIENLLHEKDKDIIHKTRHPF